MTPRPSDDCLWARVVSFKNLHEAWRLARLGKRDRHSVARFALDCEGQILQLREELLAGTYQHGDYRRFTIYERKPRLIAAAPFRDRVVHHALMRVVEPVLDAGFLTTSFACRKERGVHAAVDHYQGAARRFAYVLKLDVSSYFASIRHEILLQQLQRRIKDPDVLRLFATILSTYRSDANTPRGLPIGNLTSQFLANLYLDDLDHEIADSVVYQRYVDDLMLLADSKEQLWSLHKVIVDRLALLGLTLKPSATRLQRTSERVDVLGYVVNRHRRWLRNENGHRYTRRLKHLAREYAQGRIDLSDVRSSVQAWIGHARHAHTEGLRRTVLSGVAFTRHSA